jgi:signal transduction histidine kinase
VTQRRLVVRSTEEELLGRWDPLRLGRVLENLIGNAVKYSPDGSEITISLTRERGAGRDEAVLAVQDRGIGISEHDLPHIFDRFYRGENAQGGISGSGLGLAGTRQIVEQHGGTIEVDSREGAGSTFTVRLPLSPASG